MTAVRLLHITKTFRVFDDAAEYSGKPKDTGEASADSPDREPGGVFYALRDVSLDIEAGVCTVITGANGSGKSLLMAVIAGLENPVSGNLDVYGKVGLVFQDADSQILGETPREDVEVGIPGGFRFGKKGAAATTDIVEKALGNVGLLARADFPSRFLSGGEKRRLAAAGVLAMNADIIIFDEPYANLDYGGVVQTNTVIRDLLAKSKTVVILTHELEKCLAFAQRLAVLHKGQLVFTGSPEEGLRLPLEQWGIRHPLRAYARLEDLLWL
ncbi:MAG: energy-coupling factor ABC transporter ATP-binding protein [Spirochaetaceae bacterium]|jgi:biotin transport system ATP-binding protein|nr:energy-coupling factor ABC transporter ATP-binding protein [Spirochaetaceae bacterium]